MFRQSLRQRLPTKLILRQALTKVRPRFLEMGLSLLFIVSIADRFARRRLSFPNSKIQLEFPFLQQRAPIDEDKPTEEQQPKYTR